MNLQNLPTRFRVLVATVGFVVSQTSCASEGGDADGDSSESEKSDELGNGPNAQRRRELDAERCAVEAACGLERDPPCQVYEQSVCAADLMNAECFAAFETLQLCTIGLTCEQLEHYMFNASAPGRPCQAETDGYHEDLECPNISGIRTECDDE